MVLEAEVEVWNDEDLANLERDLVGELMKIKSGLYDNRFYGSIISVERLEVGKTEIEVDDDEEADNTEGINAPSE